LLKENLLLRRR